MSARLSLALILLLSLLLIPFSEAQVSVGVSPSALNLGEVKRGELRIGKFNMVTTSNMELLVYLNVGGMSISSFGRKYPDLISNFSEESSAGWVEFIGNPLLLRPTTELAKAVGGGIVKGLREVSFILKVPKNAEPGYHSFIITPLPEVVGAPGTVKIRAVVGVPVYFKIPGDVIRSGKILDVATGKYLNGMLELKIFFKNTGTVTMSAKASSVEIYDKYGRLLTRLSSAPQKVKPNETKVLTVLWDVRGLDVGEYKANVTVDYITGKVVKEAPVYVYALPPPKPPAPLKIGVYFPLWILVLIAIILIGIIIYRRA